MGSISNDHITASFKSFGAELTSLKTSDGHEYLWQGHPDYWTGQSPLLFPIIGGLPEGAYEYDGVTYAMPNHGFARKMDWRVESHEISSIIFTLESNEQTLTSYPFAFKLSVIYTVINSSLKVEYKVENLDRKNMPFQIGGHPAFNCPITDYKLVFEKEENSRRLLKEGLLTGETAACLENTNTLYLTHSLFDNDALIFRDLKSHEISLLRKDGKGRKVKMKFPGFTHFGIWKKPKTDAPFICLEPWFGVDSTEEQTSDLTDKEGIIILSPCKTFSSAYYIELI